MPDREKIIKAVEDAFDLVHSDFIGTDDFNETEWEQNKADALALLKEQDETIKELQNAYGYLQKQFFDVQDELLKEHEAVEPRNTYSMTPSGKVIPHIFCGKCNKEIYAIYAFCPFCGQAVKWG